MTRIITAADMQRVNNRMAGYVLIKVDVRVALELAGTHPRPERVITGIMKAVANQGYVTLEQLRALLGLTAQRALRE